MGLSKIADPMNWKVPHGNLWKLKQFWTPANAQQLDFVLHLGERAAYNDLIL